MIPDRADRPLRAKPRRDWRVTIVLILTVVVVSMLAVGTPAVITSANTGRQIQEGSNLSSCRSVLNAVVTDKRTDLDRRRVENEALQNQFIQSILSRDTAALATIGPRLEVTRTALVAAASALDDANDVYQGAVILSSQNPTKFLSTYCPSLKGK